MYYKYILIFILSFNSLYATVDSLAIEFEKKYYLNKQKSINCYITEFSKDMDKEHCIKASYDAFSSDLASLFHEIASFLTKENSSKEIFPINKNGGEFYALFGTRINATFRGEYGEKKREELTKFFHELKKFYRKKQLEKLHIININLPKNCENALNNIFEKQLKSSKFISIAKRDYYNCLAQNISKEKNIMPIVPEPIDKVKKIEYVADSSPEDIYRNKEVSTSSLPPITEKPILEAGIIPIVENSFQENIDSNEEVSSSSLPYIKEMPTSEENIMPIEIEDIQDSSPEEFINNENNKNDDLLTKEVIKTCQNIDRYYYVKCKKKECVETNAKSLKRDVLSIMELYNHLKEVITKNSLYCSNSLIAKLNSYKEMNKIIGSLYTEKISKLLKDEILNYKSRFKLKKKEKMFSIQLFSLLRNKKPKLPKNFNCKLKYIDGYTVGECSCISQKQLIQIRESGYPDVKIKGEQTCKEK